MCILGPTSIMLNWNPSYIMSSDISAQELGQKAGRFRVVIIGPANSGKTTILKKICNTTDDPVVYDSRGEVNCTIRVHRHTTLLTSCILDADRRICAKTNPTGQLSSLCNDLRGCNSVIQRGMHDIEHQMVFRSSPGFVFHDSRGFEAGGVDEIKKVKAFISERSKAKNLQDQVHVIWCVCFAPNNKTIGC